MKGHTGDLTEDFFLLGPIMDWLAPQRDSIARGKAEMDEALIAKIKDHRDKFDADPQWLDKAFPPVAFDKAPATFVYHNLIRSLIIEAKSHKLTRNDGIDFCQAVLAVAFTAIATLDKPWKRRIQNLPQPNKVARVYYSQELDGMVDDIEASLQRIECTAGLLKLREKYWHLPGAVKVLQISGKLRGRLAL
jgi:hypothetical protein